MNWHSENHGVLAGEKGAGRIVSVVASFPSDSSFLLNKFLGLVNKNIDIRMVCLTRRQADNGRATSYDALESRIRTRVKFGWPTESRGVAALLLPLALAKCLLKNFQRTCYYLMAGWRRFGLSILQRLYLDTEIICARPDVLHFEFGPLAVGRMYLRDLLGCKAIVSFRGYDLNFVRLDDELYYQEIWNQADALHLLGEDLWQRAQTRGCPQDKRHRLIPPAIDTDFYDPKTRQPATIVGITSRPLRILSVGRLTWKKGYEYSLEAVRHLIDQGIDCEYRIVGAGEYLEAIAFARHQLGLDDKVTLLGELPPPQVKEQMEWADIFLHAAVSEGFCNAVLEAQAMRLPVVCTDADGLSENISDGETGFVVARRNPMMLATKMTLLAANPSLRMRMGTAGRQRVLKQFQLVDQIRAFEQLYLDVLSFPGSELRLVMDRVETAHAG